MLLWTVGTMDRRNNHDCAYALALGHPATRGRNRASPKVLRHHQVFKDGLLLWTNVYSHGEDVAHAVACGCNGKVVITGCSDPRLRDHKVFKRGRALWTTATMGRETALTKPMVWSWTARAMCM